MGKLLGEGKVKPDGLASLELFTKEELSESEVRRANATLSDLYRSIDENDPSWINREDGSYLVHSQKTSTPGSNKSGKMSLPDHISFLKKRSSTEAPQTVS